MNKKIYFITDKASLWLNFPTEKSHYTYQSTTDAIRNGDDVIYTTSLANMNFNLLDLGYQIFLYKDKKMVEIKPGMEELDKDLRKEHNILKMFLGGVFNECF